VRPWAHGWFRRPPGKHGLPQQGEIWVCKLGWWAGAPWDVLAYAKSHATFPGDSTLEQLYDAPEFDAYHELGVATGQDAVQHCVPPRARAPRPVSATAPAPAPAAASAPAPAAAPADVPVAAPAAASPLLAQSRSR